MRDLVKYSNRLNKLNFSRFNSKDMDIFFSIISKVTDKGDTPVTISFDELKSMSNIEGIHMVRQLNHALESMATLVDKQEDSKNILFDYIFPGFEIAKEVRVVRVKVNPGAVELLNEIKDNFTRFSLKDFTSIGHATSKNLFRLLKQWRTVGKVPDLSKEDFIKELHVSKSYANNLTQKVIDPAISELSPFFNDLDIRKVKYGREIQGFKITFKPESPTQDDFDHSKEARDAE